MEEKQFDNFWEMKCPKCGTNINLEIIVNHLSNNDVKIKKK